MYSAPAPPCKYLHQHEEAPFRIKSNDPFAAEKISSVLTNIISEQDRCRKMLRCILCIGSDRSTGDALGPLVGSQLIKSHLPRTMVWGTLACPVHALNLGNYLRKIDDDQKRPFMVIAVDASLGKPGSIGVIEVAAGPLFPGAGVHKHLPPVGHMHLSGIVNLGGFMEQMVLQSTRLFHVMEMAAVIAEGLRLTLTKNG